MVDALGEIHRVLAPRGILIDARPDSRVPAYVERKTAGGFQRFGLIRTNRVEMGNDRASDHAIAQVQREGLFKSKRRGSFRHLVPFTNLADVRSYLHDHSRFVHRAQWLVETKTRRRYARENFVIRRAVRYEVLSAIKATVPSTAIAASEARMQ